MEMESSLSPKRKEDSSDSDSPVKKNENEIHSYFAELHKGNREYIEMVRSVQIAFKREEAIRLGQILPELEDWSPYDTSFTYMKDDIRIGSFTGTINLKIVKYVSVKKIICSVDPENVDLAFHLDLLNNRISEYVRTLPPPPKLHEDEEPLYSLNEVVLFRMPTNDDFEFMKKSMGRVQWEKLWFSEPEDAQKDTEMSGSGNWFRGFVKKQIFCYASRKGETVKKVCKIYVIRSLENGQKVPVSYYNIRKCVFTFAVLPSMTAYISLLLSSERQYDKRAEYKWSKLLSKYKKIKVKVVTSYEEITAVRMIEPSEKELNIEWEKLMHEDSAIMKEMSTLNTLTPPGHAAQKDLVNLGENYDDIIANLVNLDLKDSLGDLSLERE